MTDLAHYITDYGYWALFIGCLAEGETITLLGGIAAHEGLLHWPWVIAVGGARRHVGGSAAVLHRPPVRRPGHLAAQRAGKSASRAPEG